jgi:predicted dehydrogenase
MSKIKVLIAGLGGIAQIAHLPIIHKMTDVEIAGVCDIERGKAKAIALNYNIKNYYTDFEKMLNEAEADCLIVSTPTNLHKEIAISGLEAGLNVLVEKPFTRNLAEGEKIVEAATKKKKKLMVGMNNRFRPDFMMQESFVSSNELGNIFYIKTGFIRKRSTIEKWALDKEQSGGGVIMDLGIVVLDMALWLMKFPKIKSVTAVNYYHNFKTVEDTSIVFLKFANGVTVNLESSWTLHREHDIFYSNVFGTEGSSSINPLRIYKRMHGTLVNVTPLKLEKPANIFKRSYEYELQHFFNSVRTGDDLISSGEEALLMQRITESIYKSANTGKEVVFK